MAAASNAALDLFRALPKAAKARLNLVDPKAMAGAVPVKEHIQNFYKKVWDEEKQLRAYKEAIGYCAGRASCMTFVGKGAEFLSCTACRKYYREIRATAKDKGPRRLSAISEYGQIRRKERELEKRERDRLKAR